MTPAERVLHDGFVGASRNLRAEVVRTAAYLVAIHDRKIHKALGFPRIADYALAHAGISPRTTVEFLRLGRQLHALPLLREALAKGDLSWARAREISAHATPANEAELVDLARRLSRDQLREHLRQGEESTTDAPGTTEASAVDGLPPDDPRMVPTIVQAGERTPQESTSSANRRRAGSTSRAAPRPGVTLRHEPTHGLRYVQFRLTSEQLARWEALLEHALAKGVGGGPFEVILAALETRAGNFGGPPPYLIVLLTCPSCHEARLITGRGEVDVPQALLAAATCDATVADTRGERRRTIPPRLRRLALQRARYHCEAAGCRHTRFLEIHHRQPVAAGGGDDLANLVVLCSACHRRLHEHEAQVRFHHDGVEALVGSFARLPGKRSSSS